MTGLPSEVFERIGGASSPAPAAASTLANPERWFINCVTGNPTGQAGPTVNERTALNYAAVYSCVSLIAGTIASLPLKVYRKRTGGDGQDEAFEHPVHALLQNEFNPNTSAMTGRETGVGHLMTWGNSFAQVVRGKPVPDHPFGKVLRLQPVGPDVVLPETSDAGALQYRVWDRKTGKELRTLPRGEVLHVPGLSFDALCGYSTARVARSVIRTGMAMEAEAERFVTRGIRPPGAIKLPAGHVFANGGDAITFRNTFQAIHATEDGSQQVIILEDGAEWQSLGTDPESAQLLESRMFTALEVCGIYHVPPHMVGLVEKTSAWGTGVEELTIGFVVYCLLPILRRIEQEYNRKLFAGEPGVFCEHVLSGLLRGDTKKQAEALQIYMNLGLLTVNEGRRMLGWNPIVGGNVRYFPLNMGRVDDDGNDIPPPPPAAGGATKKPDPKPDPFPVPGVDENGPDARRVSPELAAPLLRAFTGAVGRCVRKEAEAARRAAAKPSGFAAWVNEFYGRHGDMVTEQTGAVLDAWAAAGGGPAPDFAARHVDRSRAALLGCAARPPGELAAAVEALTAVWLTDRAAEAAAELQPPVPCAV